MWRGLEGAWCWFPLWCVGGVFGSEVVNVTAALEQGRWLLIPKQAWEHFSLLWPPSSSRHRTVGSGGDGADLGPGTGTEKDGFGECSKLCLKGQLGRKCSATWMALVQGVAEGTGVGMGP